MCWDLSVRLGYFVTNLGLRNRGLVKCWDLSVRLGYFVTFRQMKQKSMTIIKEKLGFERKARLFCDNFYIKSPAGDGVDCFLVGI